MDARLILSMSPAEVWRQYRNQLQAVRQCLADYLDTVGWDGEELGKVVDLDLALYDYAISEKQLDW